jgi:hypothetical protein
MTGGTGAGASAAFRDGTRAGSSRQVGADRRTRTAVPAAAAFTNWTHASGRKAVTGP